MTDQEKMFNRAVDTIVENAQEYRYKKPAMSTLLEEVAEVILSSRGKHSDYLKLEITQIGGICINILSQLYDGREDRVCNIGHGSRPIIKKGDE